MNMMSMLLASDKIGGIWGLFPIFRIIFLVIMAICALFIIAVVLLQPGNSSGIGALGGTTETFLGKNKGKTFESKMKKLTVVAAIVFTVLAILYAVLAVIG